MSKENYDWLGHGIYFWENNYERALEWAKDKTLRGTLKKPSVVGAVLQPGNCYNLTDKMSIDIIISYYKLLKDDYANIGEPLLVNKNIRQDKHHDLLLRDLDCTLLEYSHARILAQYKADLASKGYSSTYKSAFETRTALKASL